MPNWASVSYVIEGPEETLQKIQNAVEEHTVVNGASDDWEGNVCVTLGIDEKNIEGFSIRGFIQDTFYEGEILRIYADEAWSRTEFAEILQDLFPDELTIYWYIEEPGMGIYETNDADGNYFPERYYVEYGDNMEYFDTEKELFEWLSDITESQINNYDDVEEFNNENPTDPYIYINEIDVIL